MSIETRLRNTGQQGGVGGGGSSDSAGLAGSGGLYVVTSASPLLPNSRILAAGSSTLVRTDSTSIYVDATTATPIVYASTAPRYVLDWLSTPDPSLPNAQITVQAVGIKISTVVSSMIFEVRTNFIVSSAAPFNTKAPLLGGSGFFSTSGMTLALDTLALAGSGSYYIVGSTQTALINSKVLTAGSSVTTHTDATAFYINAITSAGASSGGLAGTGGLYVVTSASPLLPGSRILSPGSAVLIRTDTTGIYVSATSDIPLARVGTSTYFRLQEYANFAMSPGRIDGGVISTSATTFSVTSGSGLIKATDSNTDTLLFFDWPALGATGTTANTVRFVGVTYSGGAPVVIQRTTQSWDYDTEFPLGIVVNDSGSLYVINNPWGTSDAMTNVIERFDSMAFVERDNRVGGLIISDSGTRRVIISAGTVLSRLSEFGISAINTTVAGSGTFDAYYRDGAGGWTKETGNTQWENTLYDDGDGTLASIPALSYASRWFYIMADSSVAMLYGQSVNAAPAIIFD